MKESHYVKNPSHPIVFSFADFSFWCYECDSYVVHPLLTHQKYFYSQKFPEGVDTLDALAQIKDEKFKGDVEKAPVEPSLEEMMAKVKLSEEEK